MSPFWIVSLSILGGVGAVVGIGWFIWWLVERRPSRKKDKETQKILQEMRVEIKQLKEQNIQTQFYLDGIPEVRDRRKAVIYRDAFRAMREYQHDDAIKKFQEAFPLASDPSERCAILNLIGLSRGKSGATRDAEKTYLEVIKIAEQAKIEDALAVAYGNIGVVYYILGELRKALEYFEEALKINEKIGNLEGQASQLGNIGIVHYSLGKLRNALEYYEKSLGVAEQIGNKKVQAQILGNIGVTYATLDEPQKALGYQQKALGLAEKIGNLEIQAKALGNIGIVNQSLGEPHKVFEYLEKALEINEKIGNLEGQAEGLVNIGVAYGNKGDHQKALDYFQSAREKFVRIEAKLMIEKMNHYIALAKQKLAEKKK